MLFKILETMTAKIYITLIKKRWKVIRIKRLNISEIYKYENDHKLLKKYQKYLPQHRSEYSIINRARSILVNKNVGLVLKIMQKYYIKVLYRQDVYQEGIFAIIKCISRFEYRRGLRFSTYLTWWARQLIGKASFEQTQAITIPLYILNKNRYDEFKPSSKISYSKYYNPESKHSFGETQEGQYGDFETIYKDGLDLKLIKLFIENFKQKYEFILRAYWGVGCPCQSISKISNRIGVKHERIKQIIYSGQKKINSLMKLRQLENITVSLKRHKSK